MPQISDVEVKHAQAQADARLVEMFNRDGGPAFPSKIELGTGSGAVYFARGMNLRNYLVGQALAGLCHSGAILDVVDGSRPPSHVAKIAVAIADSTLKELQK